MKKNSSASIIILILLASVYFVYDSGLLGPYLGQDEPDTPVVPEGDTIKIAAFNIQVFGRTKRVKKEVMNILAQIVREFDVVLVQEYEIAARPRHRFS